MIDLLFMEFYIKKRYNLSLRDYFSIRQQAISKWRADEEIPSKRIMEFLKNEGSLNPHELLKSLYIQ